MELGYHDAIIVATALGGGGDKAEHIAVQVEVSGESGSWRGTAYLYCSPAAWPYTEDKLRGIGWDAQKSGYMFEDLNGDGSPLIGKPVRINVEEEEYQGKTRKKITGIFGPGLERMHPQEAASFADKLRKKLLGGKGGAPLGEQHPPHGVGSPLPAGDDESLPF